MSFLEEFFINPIIYRTGYNVVNTITFAILLIIALFGLIKLLQKLNIKTNKKLWYDLIPFVLLGGITRALQDLGFFAKLGALQYLFVTPLIYFVIFFLAFGSIIVSKYTKFNITRDFGYFLVLFFLAFVVLRASNWNAFGIILSMSFLIFFAIYFAFKFLNIKILENLNSFPMFAHILDSSASVTAIMIVGGYTEQHVVPSFLFTFLPYWTFIPIKILIILLALYVIDKETSEKKEWNWMLKFTVFVLGMGPGLRNLLTVFMGA